MQGFPSISLTELPLLITPKQAAAVMGPSESQIRALIHSGRLAHVLVGRRIMIPRDAIERFIRDNTVLQCLDEMPVPASAISINGAVFTSAGRSEVAAGSAARALLIAERLKSPLRSSSPEATAPVARVIQLRSS
jgi:excisionase family DNA binding protein